MDVLANVDAAANPVPTARFMGGRELEVLTEGRAPVPDLGASELRAIVERGTLALPCFARQGGPYRDQPGEIVGPRPETDREWAALGILYCALMTDDALDRIGARGPCIIEGRFATTPAYGRLLAGLRPDTPVSVATEATGTLSGALALAFPARRDAPASRLAPCAPLDLPGLAALRDRWRRRIAERMTT
jgi:hypothetical protein